MKIRILVNENISYKSKVLDICKNNRFLESNIENIEYFNDNNWEKIFTNIINEIKVLKKFDRLCIFDEYGFLPFYFFTKQIGFVAALPFDEVTANLCRAHNNANTIIITKATVSKVDNILDTFFTSNFEGGRHATRCQLMQEPYIKTNKIYSFDSSKEKTIVLASDHAGYLFKKSIKEYLVKKGYHIIDVGCSSAESTHYPLFAMALVKNSNKAAAGIVFCSTGVGMANTVNNFRGMNCFICKDDPTEVRVARKLFNANVMSIPSKFIKFEDCIKVVDAFLSTEQNASIPNIENIDNYGFDLDMSKFNKIELDKKIEIPKELK